MGNLNINNPNIISDRPSSLQHYTEAANQLDFKPDRNHDQVNSDSTRGLLQKDLQIFHQNIRGLNGKTEEIMNNMLTNPPQVLCLVVVLHHVHMRGVTNGNIYKRELIFMLRCKSLSSKRAEYRSLHWYICG